LRPDNEFIIDGIRSYGPKQIQSIVDEPANNQQVDTKGYLLKGKFYI